MILRYIGDQSVPQLILVYKLDAIAASRPQQSDREMRSSLLMSVRL